MTLSIYQIDAFTDQLFHGNPAAVVPLEQWLSDTQMQAIARENNLSETAFFVPGDDGFHLRWFTPAIEVDFCGHATLATAHVLFQHLDFEGETIIFDTRVGHIKVGQHGGWYIMDAPVDELREMDVTHDLVEALGEAPRELYCGREDLLAILESEAQVAHLRPNFGAIAKATERGLIVSAQGNEVDFVSRCFFPNAGIDEDPVTGSAHTTMVPYWAERLGKQELEARQISARGGYLKCVLKGDRVILQGQAVTYLTGTAFIPG